MRWRSCSSASDWGGCRPNPASGSAPESDAAAAISDQRQKTATGRAPLPKTNLIATEKAITAAAQAISLVKRVPAPLKSIADQVIRSASSVPANLAEGHGRFGRDRIHHWRIAYASAKEADCHLRILCHAGAVPREKAIAALQLFDEIRAMTWKLLHP